MVPGLRDRDWARQWLQSFKSDDVDMFGFRTLLSQHCHGFSLDRMSHEAVINEVAALLASGRIHVHSRATFGVCDAGGQVQTAGANLPASQSEQDVPFPLSERKRPVYAPPHSERAPDLPMLPSRTDSAQQAGALIAAAQRGVPFVCI